MAIFGTQDGAMLCVCIGWQNGINVHNSFNLILTKINI